MKSQGSRMPLNLCKTAVKKFEQDLIKPTGQGR